MRISLLLARIWFSFSDWMKNVEYFSLNDARQKWEITRMPKSGREGEREVVVRQWWITLCRQFVFELFFSVCFRSYALSSVPFGRSDFCLTFGIISFRVYDLGFLFCVASKNNWQLWRWQHNCVKTFHSIWRRSQSQTESVAFEQVEAIDLFSFIL